MKDSPFVDEKVELNEDQLGVVAELANQMISVDDEISELEEELKKMKKIYRDLNECQIPEKLMEMGLTKLELTDGTSLALSSYYSAKIPDERKEEAFMWLKANHHDSIIKSKVDCAFGKGEEETRQEEQLVAYLSRQNIPYKHKRGVHPQTLKAFVKEQIEGGIEIPQDLFGVYIGQQIKIRRK